MVANWLRRWKTHVDVTFTLNISESSLFQEGHLPCHTASIVQKSFEEHDQKLKVLTQPLNLTDNKPVQWKPHHETSKRLKGSAAYVLVLDTTGHH